jgi:hypothetical protein
MTDNKTDPGSEDRRTVFSDLRRRNERRMDVARMLEARRRRQIERVMQTARSARGRGRRS